MSGPSPGAAETLNMSPPAVGQQIRALENHLDRALFERVPQSVMLTEAGRAYLPAGAQALHGIESTTADLFGEPGTLAPGGDLFADARVGLARAPLAGT